MGNQNKNKNSLYLPEDKSLLFQRYANQTTEHLIRTYPRHLAGFEVELLLEHELHCYGLLQNYGVAELDSSLHTEQQLPLISHTDHFLPELHPGQLSIDELLTVAHTLADCLCQIHGRDLIHLSLRPGVFRLSNDLTRAELFDFTSAEYLPKDQGGITSFRPTMADPYYLAPEQSYQFNHLLDTRTDLYSLGAILYWLFSGSAPYAHLVDEAEVTYAHIAETIETPTRLLETSSTIKDMCFYSVIEALMVKDPLHRYQSASALKKDLEKLMSLNETELSDFQVAKQSSPDRLYVPNKLYGREGEIQILLDAFNRVERGPSEAVLVAGYSGVGKSSLVYEIQPLILRSNGLFVWGKYDQYQSAKPYSAISQAFNHFFRNIQSMPPEQLTFWRNKLETALYPNAQVLIEVIPELGKVLGPQPDMPPVGPEEQQNRFNGLFLKLVHTISTEHKPLVVFIDDLQWADLASIHLLKTLLCDEENQFFFLVGAYRNNEVDSRHPFMQILQVIEKADNKANSNVSQLELQPLSRDHMSQLVRDTLRLSVESVSSLVDMVYQKTNGNPFFLKQFLHELYKRGILTFNLNTQMWNWDLSAVSQMGITENVVDLMLNRIGRLPKRSQRLLMQASCIGSSFETRWLQDLQPSLSDYKQALQPVLTSGLLIVDGSNFTVAGRNLPVSFLHDRVQQAAYSLMSDSEQAQQHYSIGQLMLSKMSVSEREDRSYELLEHLNKSKHLLQAQEQRLVASINLMAAEKAKESTAYALAVDYLEHYFSFPKQTVNTTDYYPNLLLLESLYLCGRFDDAESLKDNLLNVVKNDGERLQLQFILITQYTRYGFLDRAIEQGLSGLQEVGFSLPSQPDMQIVGDVIADVRQCLDRMPFAELARQSEIQDPNITTQIELLMAMQPCCYNSGSLIFPLTILELLKLTMEHGNSRHSSYIYMMYGLLCTKVLKDYPTAFEAEKYSRIVGKDFHAPALTVGRLSMMRANFILPWQTQLSESSEVRDQAYHACFEQGDYYWGVHAYIFGFYADLFCVRKIDHLLSRTQKVLRTCEKIKQPAQVYLSQLQTNLLNILNGSLDNLHNLDHIPGYENEALGHYNTMNYMCGKYDRLLGRLLQGYLFGNYLSALEVSLAPTLTEADIDEGIFHEAVYTLFNLLSILALRQQGETIADDWAAWFDGAILKLNQLEELNPTNFSAPAELVRAEQGVLNLKPSAVYSLYESAIEKAELNGFALLQALANERMGKYRIQQASMDIGVAYLNESIRLYQSWGALAKVSDIKHFIKQITPNEKAASAINLNWESVFNASHTLTRQLDNHDLTQQFLYQAAHATGAQIVSLFTDEEGDWHCMGKHEVDVFEKAPEVESLPERILHYCRNSGETLLLSNACQTGDFINEDYVKRYACKSLLAIPLLQDNKDFGILVFENRSTSNLFTPTQLDVVNLLIVQYLISFSNNRLYNKLLTQRDQLEDLVSARTEEIARKNTHLESILHALPLPYALTRLSGEVISANERFQELFNFTDETESGANVLDFYLLPTDRQRMVDELQETGVVSEFECQLKSDNGKPFWAQFSAVMIELDGEHAIFSVVNDISERKRKENMLSIQANTDPLTGILNRRAFFRLVEKELLAHRHQEYVLAMVDLDHFKRLNDTFGHAVGDIILKEFSTLVQKFLRDEDLFGRFGGEEFVLALKDVNTHEANRVLERIRTALHAFDFRVNDQVINVTASFGATCWVPDEKAIETIERADQALYIAKESGRNRVAFG